MAQEEMSTSSTPSVQEYKERYELEQEHFRELFKQTTDALRQLKDPNSNPTSKSVGKYKRAEIRRYLQNPSSDSANLRKASRYYYYVSQLYRRLINFYTGMWQLQCRQVIPPYTLIKEMNPDKTRKIYENTLNQLELYDVQNNFYEVAQRAYLEDVVFTIFVRDKTGAFFYILDPDDCVIDSKYMEGGYGFSIKAVNYTKGAKGRLAEWFGEPFTSIINEYNETKEPYIHVDDHYAAAFKFDTSDLAVPVVPFSGILQELATLGDIEDNQALLDSDAVYKLLAVPLETLTNASGSDQFKVSPAIMVEYLNILNALLPVYTASALVPGELTNNNVIDFSSTSADQDVDRIENNQKNLLNTSGGGVLIGSNNVKLSAEFLAWLKMESQFAVGSLMPQIEGHINRFLSYDVKGERCKVKFFECTIYTKDDIAASLLSSCQYSFSNRLAYNTFLGISEKSTLAMEYLESDVLGLPSLMNHPLQSSYTTAGGEDNSGRPETPEDELTDSGERSRNLYT